MQWIRSDRWVVAGSCGPSVRLCRGQVAGTSTPLSHQAGPGAREPVSISISPSRRSCQARERDHTHGSGLWEPLRGTSEITRGAGPPRSAGGLAHVANRCRLVRAHAANVPAGRPRTCCTVGQIDVSSSVPSRKKAKNASTYSAGICSDMAARAASSGCASKDKDRPSASPRMATCSSGRRASGPESL